MKVYKFGGAAVRDAQSIRNLKNIILSVDDDLMIVVSAMGKTTNALEIVFQHALNGDKEQAYSLWQIIYQQHQETARELQLSPADTFPATLIASFEQLLFNSDTADPDLLYDQVVSIGELLSSLLFSTYLCENAIENEWLDITCILLTDNRYREANVDIKISRQRLINTLKASNKRCWVTQGFIGADEQGNRTTLGREGSDYTAAFLAQMLSADSVTIWKDVPGILNADPRLRTNTTLISQLNYNDAIELAYSGAQVIHPKAIRPVENANIPLFVRPFNDPQSKGTVIKAGIPRLDSVPVYIERPNQMLITMRAKDFSFLLEESLSDIFDLIHRYRLRVSLIQSSAVSISVSVDNTYRVMPALKDLQQHYSVSYNEGLTLLTIRGTTPRILQQEMEGKTILLSQTTRRTARLLYSNHINN